MTQYSDYQQKAIKAALSAIENTLSDNSIMTSTKDVERYLKIQLGGELEECFGVIFLTSQHQFISFEKLFRGTINLAHVHIRVIARKALEANAAAVVLAHNHPSGVAEPSSSDRTITDLTKIALEMFDIKVLDHFVVSPSDTCSFADRGWI